MRAVRAAWDTPPGYLYSFVNWAVIERKNAAHCPSPVSGRLGAGSPFLHLSLQLFSFRQSAGGGTVEIQFVRYKNSAHKDNSGYCCETYLTFFCFNNCDNYFVVCLRDYGPTNDAACTHTRTTGEFDDDVAFGIGTNALKNGQDNPLLLDFDGAWKVLL